MFFFRACQTEPVWVSTFHLYNLLLDESVRFERLDGVCYDFIELVLLNNCQPARMTIRQEQTSESSGDEERSNKTGLTTTCLPHLSKSWSWPLTSSSSSPADWNGSDVEQRLYPSWCLPAWKAKWKADIRWALDQSCPLTTHWPAHIQPLLCKFKCASIRVRRCLSLSTSMESSRGSGTAPTTSKVTELTTWYRIERDFYSLFRS